MSKKTTNVLLALLLLVGVYFVFIERDTPTTYEREQAVGQDTSRPGTPVFVADDLSTESVVSVTIGRDNVQVVLTKDGQDWFQSQPVSFPLNLWSVRQVIDDAAGLRYYERFEPGSGTSRFPTLDQASLSPPLAIVTLHQANGDPAVTQTVHLGRQTIGGRGYIRLNDDRRVYVVDDALHRQVLEGQVADWRKRSIDAPTDGQARKVVLERDGRFVSMGKTEGRWSLDTPLSGRVDPEAVKGLLATIGQSYIQKFVADNPKDLSLYGLDHPGTVLRVELPAAAEPAPSSDAPTQPTDPSAGQVKPVVKTLRIGAPVDLKNEHYFATWSTDSDGSRSVVFTLSASDVQKFDKSADDLRDARVTPMAAGDVRELTIATPLVSAVKLVRGVEGWSFAESDVGFEVDSGAVSSLVESISLAKAKAYGQVDALGHEALATVTLAAMGRFEPDVLRVYPKTPGDVYPVLRNNETAVYFVPSDQLKHLFEPLVSLRQRVVLDLGAHQIKRLTIQRANGHRYEFELTQSAGVAEAKPTTRPATAPATQPAAGHWTLRGDDVFETEAFERFLSQFLPLRAERWVTPSHGAEVTGASDHLITVGLEGVDGSRHTVVLDPGRRRGSLTNEAGDPEEWFELDQSVVAMAGDEFRLRTVLPVRVDEMTSVQVVRPDNDITIRRDPATGQYKADGGQVIDSSAVGGLFDAIAGLRVDRFVEPEHVPEPPLRIVVQTASGQTYRLAVADPQSVQTVVTNGNRWFTVSADVLAKLSAPLVLSK